MPRPDNKILWAAALEAPVMIAEKRTLFYSFKAQNWMHATDLLSEHLYGGHHCGNVDTSSEGVQGNVLLFTSSSHPLTHFLQELQADEDTERLLLSNSSANIGVGPTAFACSGARALNNS